MNDISWVWIGSIISRKSGPIPLVTQRVRSTFEKWLINDNQFIDMDLLFIKVLGDESAPVLRLLEILLQLHNARMRMASIKMCKTFHASLLMEDTAISGITC